MRALACGAPAYLFSENLDCCHHGGNVHACCEGVQGDLILLAGSANLLADLLQRSTATDVRPVPLQDWFAFVCTAAAQVPSRTAGQRTAHRPECRTQAPADSESLLLVEQAVQADCLKAHQNLIPPQPYSGQVA